MAPQSRPHPKKKKKPTLNNTYTLHQKQNLHTNHLKYPKHQTQQSLTKNQTKITHHHDILPLPTTNKHIPLHLLLLMGGDIETNPGPMPDVL